MHKVEHVHNAIGNEYQTQLKYYIKKKTKINDVIELSHKMFIPIFLYYRKIESNV